MRNTRFFLEIFNNGIKYSEGELIFSIKCNLRGKQMQGVCNVKNRMDSLVHGEDAAEDGWIQRNDLR